MLVFAHGATAATVELTAAHLVPGTQSSETMSRAEAPIDLREAWEREGFELGLSVLATYPGGPDARLVGLRRSRTCSARCAMRGMFETLGATVAEVLERTWRGACTKSSVRLEESAWLRATLDGDPAPLVLLDLNGVVRALNGAAAELLECSEQAAVGTRLSRLLLPTTSGVGLLSPGAPGWNLAAELPGGRRVEAQSRVLFGPSGFIEGALLELQPAEVMERRRQAQGRAERLQALGTVASTLAHDLNNLLAPMMASTNLLKSRLSEEERAEETTFLEETTLRAASMVREMLDFGRGTPVPVGACRLSTVVERAQQLLRRSLPKTVSVLVESGPVPAVVGSETELIRALVNLCMNARHAMDSVGHLIVRVREVTLSTPEPGAWKPIAPGHHVVVEVQDSGTGMEQSRLSSLFQSWETSRFASGGSGLGLAMVRDVLERCGGGVQVQSKVGRGTIMRLFLRPLEAAIPSVA